MPRLRTALWIRTTCARARVERALSALPLVSLHGEHGMFMHLVYDVDRCHVDDTPSSRAALASSLRSVLSMSGIAYDLAIGSMLETAPLPVPEHVSVLIVDEDVGHATALAEYLRRRGHRAITAGSGSDGLCLASASRPEAVVLDLDMPGLDAPEVCRRLRASCEARTPVVIAITGRARGHGASRAFDGHLLKPALPPRVEGHVLQLVARSRRLASLG